jgi:hypothetical protein
VLLAGQWRTEENLNHISTEDKRNTLIVEMTNHSNESVQYFQKMNDDDLIGKGAMVVFLRAAGIRNDEQLKKMSTEDQRNALIVENNMHSDKPIPYLQGQNNRELVQIGLDWFTKSRSIAAILEFYWNPDLGKVASTRPEIIASQNYNNLKSSVQLEDTFNISKEISNTSKFSQEHGFTFGIKASTEFEAGIPFAASTKSGIEVNTSTTSKWNIAEENTTKQLYSNSSPVHVPPGKAIKKVASVTSAKLDVPYRAKIRAEDGSIKWIEGTWNGASTLNLIVTQVDITELV